MPGVGLVWDLLAKDQASPAFLRVAGAADKAATSTARASAGLSSSVAKMGKVGKTLTKSVTLPLLGIAAVSVDQAAKYQKSLNVIRVATGQTSASMAVAQKGLLKISGETATSTTQLTDSLYTASKAGLPMAKSLAVVKAAAQGAKAENADLGTVTNALTSIMASYGSKLSDPVKAMDMIVRGSGLAKTTLQDFAGSLANVVPVASSLGIGFDQVAGAIDTMTQHGETAQRATDNLSNLITNLAGQNNVASQSLQQLGVNTVDLSKNLGKRGLTGSLNDVLEHIAKYDKGGVIVTSAFKQAATASASLRTEIDHMPKSLQTNAKAFDAGTMSYKDFYAYTKSLGGQQFQMAKGFINTEAQAKGFNNQLKSGNSTTKTLASTLQKALGGVTGMRTALMLSGTSAATFASDTQQVGDAAKGAGKDVLGFGDTQKTAAYKADAAKNSFHNMSIELGTALLPAFAKLADAGTKAAHWVDGLSGGQKKVLVYSAGVLAALGPVLSIGARLVIAGRGIGTFVGGATRQLSTLVGASDAAAARVAASTRNITSALAGIGVGMTLAQITKGTGKTAQAVGALGSIAIGGAIGFGVGGGPVGGVLGAVAGGLSYVADQYLSTGKSAQKGASAAQQALAQQNAAAQDLLSTLQSVNGAYGDQYRNSIIGKLGSSGNLAIASKAGLSLPSVVDTIMGKGGTRGFAQLRAQLENAASAGKLTFKQFSQLDKALQTMHNAAAGAESTWELENKAAGKALLTHNQLGVSMKKLSAAFASTGNTLDPYTAAGRRNVEIVKENVAAVGDWAVSQLKQGKSVAQVATGVENQIGALHRHTNALHLDSDTVGQLIAKYGKLPRSIVTALKKRGVVPADIQAIISKYNLIPASKTTTVGVVDAASARLNQIALALANLHDRTVTVTTLHNGVGIGGRASGGSLPEGVSAVGERGAELAIKHGSHVAILSNSQSKNFLAATGMKAPGFAGGTTPPITHVGKDWIVNGVRYASERAAKNAQSRAGKADQGTLSSAVSTAIGNVGSAPSLKFVVADVGIARIRAQIKNATTVLNEEIRKGLSKNAAKKYRAEIAAYTKEASRQLGALRVKINGSDLTALKSALKGTADDVQTAIGALIGDVQHAGGGGLIGSIRTLGSRLVAEQARLQSMTDYKTNITGTLAGAFDPTQYGSGIDFRAALGNATGTNKSYNNELTSLYRKLKGNKAGLALVNQLAQSGQTATLQTLAGESAGDLSKDVAAYSAYQASISNAGNAAVAANFGGQSIADLSADVADSNRAIADALRAFASSGIQIDGKKIGTFVDGHAQVAVDRAITALERKARTRVKSKGRR